MTATFSPIEAAQATGGRWTAEPKDCVSRGVYTDTRQPKPGALFVALKGPNFDAHDFLAQVAEQGAAAAMVEEGYLAEHPDAARCGIPMLAVRDTLQALGDLARFWRHRCHAVRTIAITGSVGKTTVKEMIASVLRQVWRVHSSRGNFNNLIGLPLEILAMPQESEALVVECGADRPGEIERLREICQPEIGIVTHVVPCHLERFESMEGIAREKGKLLAGLAGGSPHAIVNSRAAELEILLAGCKAPISFYGKGKDSRLWSERETYDNRGRSRFEVCGESVRFEVALQVVGNHQPENALAAALTALILGTPVEAIREGLQSYSGTWGRMNLVERPGGGWIVEDVYNSNPASMQAALDYLAGQSQRPRIGVFGEMWDLGPESAHWHRVTGKQMTRAHLEILLAVGPLAQGFIEGSQKSAYPPGEMHYFETTEKALQWLKENAPKGSLIYVKGSRGMKMEFITQGLKG
jgi:UDP-N-acetylmuramoyl-tripeptide--D-alanyl-D-alanine ligase